MTESSKAVFLSYASQDAEAAGTGWPGVALHFGSRISANTQRAAAGPELAISRDAATWYGNRFVWEFKEGGHTGPKKKVAKKAKKKARGAKGKGGHKAGT